MVGWSLVIHMRRLEGHVEEEGVEGVVLMDHLHGVQVREELTVSLTTLLEAVVGRAAAAHSHPVGTVGPQLPANR